ncbi:MAG: FHA domain-containing protein [Myxococcales bacterium]
MTQWAFSNHVLDVSARRLTRGGEQVHLAPKVMDLLLYLVSRSERYVAKEELQRALWGELQVGPASLPGLIKDLRRSLGEDGADAVRTLHGRGYQFTAPLTKLETPLQAAAVTPDATTAISLPTDFERADSLGIITLWPPAGPSLAITGLTRLGRGADCELSLPYEKVSRVHAEISLRGPVLVLRDLGSTNGTHVDGERVREGVVLRGDQLLRLGDWLGLVVPAGELQAPSWLPQALDARDWSGRVRELEARCRERLGERPPARASVGP